MIIKTYESDLDGLKQKLGFSKRSFAEWGTQVKDSFNNGTTMAEKFKNAVSTAFTDTNKSKESNPYLTKSGDMVTESNIDAYLPELNDQSAGSLLKKLQERQIEIDDPTQKTSWNDYFAKYKDGNKYLIEFIQNTDLQKASTKDLMEANKKARKAVIDHNKAINAQTLSAKASKVALSALAAVGNTIAMFAISEGISYLMQDLYAEEEAAKAAAEKIADIQEAYTNAVSNINSVTSDLKSHSTLVGNVSDRYAELSQKVSNLGDLSQNQGSLTADEYSEFLEISNQLAETFPSLTKGYDENGNALLSLNGDVGTITTTLQNLIDKERELANQEINNNLGDVFNGVQSNIGNYQTSIIDLEGQIRDLKSIMNEEDSYNPYDNTIYLGHSKRRTVLHSKEYDDTYNKKLQSYTALLKEYGIEYEQVSYELGNFDDSLLNAATLGVTGMEHFSEYLKILSDPDEVQKAFTQKISELNHELKTQNDLIDSSNSSIKSYISQWANTDYAVLALDQNDRNSLINVLNHIDWSKMPTEWEEAKAKIYKDYLSIFKDSPDEIKNAFSKFYSGEDITIKDYKKYKDQIKKYFEDQGTTIPTELDITFHSDISSRNVKQMNEDVQNLFHQDYIGEFKNNYEQLSLSDLVIAADVLNISDGTLTSWDELISKINEYKISMAAAEQPLPAFIEIVSQIQALSQGLDQLGSIYTNIADKDNFDWSSILNNENFKKVFGGFESEYNDFIRTVTSTPNDINACQSAFDNLATAYINDSEALKNLNSETKHAAVVLLEQMGISNAQEIISARLAAQEAFLAEKKNQSAIASNNLSDATWQEISTILAAANASDEAASYLTQLALTKLDLSNNPIDTKADIDAIIALASAAGSSKEYVNALSNALTNLQNARATAAKMKETNTNGSNLTEGIKSGAVAYLDTQVMLEEENANKLLNQFQENIDKNKLNPSDFYSKYNRKSTAKNTEGANSKDNWNEEKSKKTFNWIETAINRLKQSITNLKQKADSIYSSWSSRNLNLQAELSAVRNEIELQQQAYNRYMQQANSVGLSASWASKVQNGQVDISNITDEDLAERITQYQEWYEKALSCQDAIEELNETVSELYKTSFEHVVTQYDNILSVVEHNKSLFNEYLSQSEQSNYVSGDKNRDSLVQSIGHYENLLSEEKTNISLLEQEKSALLSALGQAVSSGSIAADSQAFTDMQNQVNGIILAIEQAKTSIQGYHNSISGLYETAFDNADSQYSNLLGVIEHQRSMLDEAISQTEEKGYLISTAYYKTLMHTEQDTITQLEQKKNALLTALNNAVSSGAVEVQSQVWYDMCSQIDEVTLSINEANTAMIKYGNSIRDIEWQVFDLQHERISALSSETDFLIELMSNDKLFDDKGKFTKEGMSTMGLYGMDYNANMFQADHYGEELKKIEQQLKQDPDNQDLEKRKQELTELQQEMILAAEDRKQSIINMVEEGIKAELDALKELISTYTDALDAQKDLYDYQKKVSAQTQELASLQKQLEAYEGDTSEENKARIQQLKVSYEEAQQALEDTEYEKYISDQKQLLDELYLEYELTLNQRLDNVDALIADVIANINSEAYNINTTIAEKADSVGYTLSESMRNIWDLSTGSINTVLAVYGGGIQNGIASAATSVNNTLNGICSNIQGMFDKLNSTANTAISVIAGSSAVNSSSASGSAGGSTVTASAVFSSAAASPAPSSSGSSGSPASTPAWGSWFIPRVYSKQKLNIDTSIVDRLKYFNFDAEKPARAGYYYAMGGTGIYTYSANQNEWMLGQMKAHGFSKGGYVADLQKTAYQNGDDIITINTLKRGEAVLTPVQAQQFHKLLARLDQLHTAVDLTERLTDRSQISAMPAISQDTIHNAIQMEVTLPNVQNYADFKYAMQHDKSFEQMVQAMTVKRAAGGSSLKKYKC